MKTFAPPFLLALAFVSLVGVLGCGGGSGSDDDPDPTDEPLPIHDVSGKILANDGTPIANAIVTARAGDGTLATLAQATSDMDGRYSVRIPEATPFYLHVEKAAYVNTNTHVRELTATRVGVDVTLLLQVQADSLLGVLGGPTLFTPTNLMFLIRAADPMGLELTDVSVQVTPIGLLVQYRLPDDSGYTNTAPTVACTAGGGCALPAMAGFSAPVDQGVSIFRFTQAGMGIIAEVAADLRPGEVTFIAND